MPVEVDVNQLKPSKKTSKISQETTEKEKWRENEIKTVGENVFMCYYYL